MSKWWTMGNPSAAGTLVMQNPSVVPTPRTSGIGFQCSFANPGTHTVQFQKELIQYDDVHSRSWANLTRAEIIWSVGGNRIRRVVNISNGLSISGTAESVSVTLWDDSRHAPAQPAGFDPTYRVSAQVIPGGRPSNQQLPTYVPDDPSLPDVTTFPTPTNQWMAGSIIVPGASTSSPALFVPNDVGAIAVEVLAEPNLNEPNILPEVDLAIGTTISNATGVASYDPRDFNWPALPQNCTIMSVTNNSTGAGHNVPYFVLFGIDG